MAKKQVVYVFLHIPKTGGTTFFRQVHENLKPGEPLNLSRRVGEKPLGKRPIEVRKKAKFLSGHATYYGIHRFIPNKIPRYIVIIRDPAERAISSYNYEMKNKQWVPFGKWYKVQIKDEMTHMLDRKFRGKDTVRVSTPYFLFYIFEKLPLAPVRKRVMAQAFLRKFNYL